MSHKVEMGERRSLASITIYTLTTEATCVVVKVKAEHLYSALHGIQTTLKRSL